jgi:hypothetical protein
MKKKDNAINRRSEPLRLDQADYNNAEEQVAHALETLRLLNDKENPLSLRQTIARARELAETYARWEQSLALIKDIAVRLSDGQEIAVDQSNVASLCGLRFINSFPADSVLHIWKKPDEQFGEVQLLSLSLKDVQSHGYSYKKTYKNGQTLSLEVVHCADGQFHVSVDYSAKERVMVATSTSYGWLPVIGAAVIALSKLGAYLRKPRPQFEPLSWQMSASFIAGLVLAASGIYTATRLPLIGASLNRPKSKDDQTLQVKPSNWLERYTLLPKMRSLQALANSENEAQPPLEHINVLKDKDVKPQPKDVKAVYEKVGGSTEARNHAPLTTAPEYKSKVHRREESAPLSGDAEIKLETKKDQTQDKDKASDAEVNKPTIIYIKTSSKDNLVSVETLRRAVINALKQASLIDRFIILPSNDDSQKAECVIDVRLLPKIDSKGVMLVELYDNRGLLLWNGDKDYLKLHSGKQLEDTTQQLLGEMLPAIESSKAERAGTD